MNQYPTSIPAVEVTAYPEYLRIYKYEIPITDEVKVQMPEGAIILSIQHQHGYIFAWALVNPDALTVERTFRIYGTGHPIQSDMGGLKFLATVQTHQGNLVWHIFEKL